MKERKLLVESRGLLVLLCECLFSLFPKVEKSPEQYRLIRIILRDGQWVAHMLLLLKAGTETDTLVSQFWFLLSCIRPDSLLSYAKLAWVWFVLAGIGVAVAWLCLVCVVLLNALQIPEKPIVRQGFQLSSQVFTDLICVPTSNGLLVMIFATGDFSDGITPDMQSWGKWVAICAYIAYLLYLCVISLARFEIDLQSGKAEVTQDFLSLALVQSTLLSYYVLQPKSYVLHLVLVGLMAGGVTLRHCVHLPYYSETANLTFIWCKGSLASACLGLIVGYFVSSSICGLILLISFSVCLLAILWLSFNSYYKSQQRKYYKRLNSQLEDYQYDLGFRQCLSAIISLSSNFEARETGKNVLGHINSVLLRAKADHKLHILLLKHYILLSVLEDERAARLCLCQAKQTPKKSLIDHYLIFKCQRRLNQTTNLEEVIYFRYLAALRSIKHHDQRVCENLSEIWSELGSVSPNISRVISLSQLVDRTIGRLKSEFKQVIKSFPGGFEVYDLFASFLDEVLGKTAKAKHWRQKANFYQAEKAKTGQKADSDSVGLFDYTSGIVLIDLNPASSCALLYMNKVALDVLNYDSNDLLLLKLSNLIPPPYSFSHEKQIRSIVTYGEHMDLDHPSQLPLLTSGGFLVFCTTRILFTCTDEHPILLLAFRPLRGLKEGAILSRSLDIESHTSHFNKYMDCSDLHLTKYNLGNLHPSLLHHARQAGNSVSFLIFKNRPFCGVFKFEQFGVRRVLFFYTFEAGKIDIERDFAIWSKGSIEVQRNILNASITSESKLSQSRFLSVEQESSVQVCAAIRDSQRFSGPQSASLFLSDGFAVRTSAQGLNSIFRSGLRNGYRISLYTVSNRQVLALIILNITVTAVIRTQVTSIMASTIITQIGLKQICVEQIAQAARMIGTFSNPNVLQVYIENLQQAVTQLETIQGNVWTEIADAGDLSYQNFLFGKEILTWELIDGEIQRRDRTVLDAVQKIINEVASI